MRRQDILEASARIFGEKGYHGTSMQEIADAVHLQKGSLYHHVASKQEILFALLEDALDLLIADLQEVWVTDLPAEEKLRAAVRAYLRRLAEHADLATVLLLEYRSLEPKLLRRHIGRRDQFEAIWRKILSEGVKAGEFREVDVAVAAFALLGMQNWLITWFRSDGRLGPEEVAGRFSDLLIDGLTNRRSPP